MPLAQEQISNIDNWLKAKLKNVECPMCHSQHTIRINDLVSAVSIDNGIFRHPDVPMIQVVCSNCAYVMNFSSGVMKIN